ncbi:MAG TPA: hypothetical protein VNM45_02270 [Bacillus sp. (in: firmicutes)]|nr:hypothetical protein [Bacillus sp. (in: firmicutes)]
MKESKMMNFVFQIVEWAVVLLLLITIIFTFKELVFLLIHEIQNNDLLEHYKLIISEILLLAVGVEIVILIVKKDIYFVIDILILATARKLITYNQSFEILICVACIFLLLTAKILKSKFMGQEVKQEYLIFNEDFDTKRVRNLDTL